MTSPMQRTIEVLKKDNIPYWIVERFIPGKPFGKRIDLFRIIDMIALDLGIIGIQVCGEDFSSHKHKILEQEKSNTLNWLENGGRLEVWGWRKLKKVKGKKATYWKPRIAEVFIVQGELYWEEK